SLLAVRLTNIVVDLYEYRFTRCGAHRDPCSPWIAPLRVQAGITERHTCRRGGQLRCATGTRGVEAPQMCLWNKIPYFCADVHRERGRIKGRHRAHARDAGQQRFPKRLPSGADWRDNSDSRDTDAGHTLAALMTLSGR